MGGGKHTKERACSRGRGVAGLDSQVRSSEPRAGGSKVPEVSSSCTPNGPTGHAEEFGFQTPLRGSSLKPTVSVRSRLHQRLLD